MNTPDVNARPKSPSIRLGESAALFLLIGILGFLFVKVVGPILQTAPELVVESLISGVPLLLAAGCTIMAVTVKLVRSVSRSAA